MARIRTIKPEFWDSPSTAKAGPWARLLYIALWNWADDYGRGTANLKELEGFAFPNDDTFVDRDGNTATFRRIVTEVSDCFGVVFYEVDGRPYYAIPTWEEHQRSEKRAKESRHPAPPDKMDETPSRSDGDGDTATFRHDATEMPRLSVAGTGEQGNRGTGEQGNRERGARKRGARLDPDFVPSEKSRATVLDEYPNLDVRREHAKFVDYFAAVPGQKGVKLDWDATWRGWMRRAGESSSHAARPGGRRQQETDDLFAAAYARAQAADGHHDHPEGIDQ